MIVRDTLAHLVISGWFRFGYAIDIASHEPKKVKYIDCQLLLVICKKIILLAFYAVYK